MTKNLLSSFDEFLNENLHHQEGKTNFRDTIDNGDLVVAMFFDHTKNQYNEDVLWSEIVDILNQYCDFVEYCITDSVCEFVGSSVNEKTIEEIKASLAKYKNRCTNFDVYIAK
jgi:hypothetical protein